MQTPRKKAFKKKAAKKKIRRNPNIPRPYNDGEWTVARYNGFIKGALRHAHWPPKYRVIDKAFVRNGTNPATGRPCKLHQCAHCEELFPKGSMSADHILPVVPVTGFDSWDELIKRLFCEVAGLQALCGQCHNIKTAIEKTERDKYK